jgi:hypothetical protein
VYSPTNSTCGSSSLHDLDWNNWWNDTSFENVYLHVASKDGETSHRVFCRGCQTPRLQMVNGKLMWLYTPKVES